MNPYHYERVVPPGIGTLDLSSLKLEQRSMSLDDPVVIASAGNIVASDDLSKFFFYESYPNFCRQITLNLSAYLNFRGGGEVVKISLKHFGSVNSS